MFFCSFSQEVSIANSFLAGVGLCSLPPTSSWDCICLELLQVLFMLSQCLWRHVCTSPAVCGTCCFLGITHHLRLLKSVYFFPHESLNLEERSLIKVSHLGPRAPVSHCLHSVRLWNFILITIFLYSFFRVDLLLLRKPCHHWYCKYQQDFHYIQMLFVFKDNNKREV